MSCCVVNQHCAAPANLEGVKTPKSNCFACGEPVCVECSSRRKYMKYGRVRLCDNCQESLDGNNRNVMQRIWNRSGYSGRVPDYYVR